MDPLSITASVIAVTKLTGELLLLLGDARGASEDRKSCMVELSNLYKLLIDLQFRLESSNTKEAWFTSIRALGASHGPLDQYANALHELSSILDKQGVKRVAQTFKWKFEKQEIANILMKFERLKNLVQIALENDHFKLSQALKQGLDAVQISSDTSKRNTNIIRIAEEQRQYFEIMDWISNSNHATQHSFNMTIREKGTGDWFLSCPEFQTWLSNSKQTLYCSGMPGAGKTIICAIAIDHITKSIQRDKVGLAFIYCNYRTRKDETVVTLLAAVLKQLVQQSASSSQHLTELYNVHHRKESRPSLNEIVQTIRLVLAEFTSTFVIVDALDEFMEQNRSRERLVTILQRLQADTGVNLMFTSRSLPAIEDYFSTCLKLEIRTADQDIRSFVSGQVASLPRCIQCNSSLQQEVEDAIATAVDGMFLVARLFVDSLQDKNSPRAIRRALSLFKVKDKTITHVYDQAYTDALERIQNQLPGNQVLAKRALAWIIWAKGSLSIEILCQALSVEPGDKFIYAEDVHDIRDVASSCAGLITVDKASGKAQLAHYTTLEYFDRLRDQGHTQWLQQALCDVARTLLTVVFFDRDSLQTSTAVADTLMLRGLALDQWASSLIGVEEEVLDQVRELFKDQSAVRRLGECMWPWTKELVHSGGFLRGPKNSNALHLIARYGLSVLASKLYATSPDKHLINARDHNESDAFTPLMIAAWFDQASVTQWLLEAGADINMATEGKLGPLAIAARRESYETFKILFNHGASIDFNSLCEASFNGDDRIVRILLESGAYTNAHDWMNKALYNASHRHYSTVYMLLGYGAPVNFNQSAETETCLQKASYWGQVDIVQALLAHGADVNAPGGDCHGTALQAACANDHVEIARIMLERGADVNAPAFRDGGTALAAAASSGNVELVQLLLGNGADVNAQGGRHGTALQAASSEASLDVLQLLLDSGAQVNTDAGKFGTALQHASMRDSYMAIERLLDNGANVNAICGKFGFALQAACYRGNAKTAKLLLDRGADPNIQGGEFDTALKAACYGANEQTVELLLDSGADLDIQGGEWGSALHVALRGGNRSLMNLLRGRRANVHAVDEQLWTVLHWAAHSEDEDIIEALLYDGASTTAQDRDGWTAYHVAMFHGFTDIAELITPSDSNIRDRVTVVFTEHFPRIYYDRCRRCDRVGHSPKNFRYALTTIRNGVASEIIAQLMILASSASAALKTFQCFTRSMNSRQSIHENKFKETHCAISLAIVFVVSKISLADKIRWYNNSAQVPAS